MRVVNKNMNGSQCTVAWSVDNNKVSHMDSSVVTDILNLIQSKFGKLSITSGAKHEYLGMNIELGVKQLEINMKQQILEAIEIFGEDLTGTVFRHVQGIYWM